MKYLLSFSIFILFACAKEATILIPELVSEKTATTYLALGDSYTIGESVPYELNYPNQLYEKLVADDIAIEEPTIIARTGWTTDELAAAIKEANPDSNYCLVSLSIGVNNQFRGYNQAAYAENFEELIQQAIAFAGGDNERVFVLSIPDYGFTPFGQRRNPVKISQELDEYNVINKMITEKYAVNYFDITAISREGLDRPELVASDGLHPSIKQYEEWVNLIYKTIKEEMLLQLERE